MTAPMPPTFRAALDAALARPLLLSQQAVAGVHGGAGFRPRAQAEGEQAPSKTAPYTRDGDVAVVAIEGPLAQRAWSCWMLEGDGYDAIEARVRAALSDRAVAAVVLRIDSPGGEVAGCFETVRALRAASREEDKPLVAYADEMACSAAYALACACDEIVVPETGCVGSVGVILALLERSRALEASGVAVNVLTSGAAKADGHPAVPLSAEARARLQQEIDQLAAVFAREVAAARPLDASEVLGLQAQTFLGERAVGAGLADRIGNLRVAIEMARLLAARRVGRRSGAQSAKRTGMDALKGLLGMAAEASDAQVLERVQTMQRRLEAAEGAVTALTADVAKANERAAAAEKKLDDQEREAILAAAKSPEAGQWTQAQDAWLRSLPLEALRAWRQTAPRVVPAGAVTPPSEPPTSDAQLPPELAALVAKGWSALSSREKHQLQSHSPALAARLRKQQG